MCQKFKFSFYYTCIKHDILNRSRKNLNTPSIRIFTWFGTTQKTGKGFWNKGLENSFYLGWLIISLYFMFMKKEIAKDHKFNCGILLSHFTPCKPWNTQSCAIKWYGKILSFNFHEESTYKKLVIIVYFDSVCWHIVKEYIAFREYKVLLLCTLHLVI